jgi:hypothetical protein
VGGRRAPPGAAALPGAPDFFSFFEKLFPFLRVFFYGVTFIFNFFLKKSFAPTFLQFFVHHFSFKNFVSDIPNFSYNFCSHFSGKLFVLKFSFITFSCKFFASSFCPGTFFPIFVSDFVKKISVYNFLVQCVGDRHVSTRRLEDSVVRAHGIKGTEWSARAEVLFTHV